MENDIILNSLLHVIIIQYYYIIIYKLYALYSEIAAKEALFHIYYKIIRICRHKVLVKDNKLIANSISKLLNMCNFCNFNLVSIIFAIFRWCLQLSAATYVILNIDANGYASFVSYIIILGRNL